MIDLGIVKPGSVIEIPFGSYVGSSGASVALTDFAVTDIEVFKDGSMTQRSSDAGYTLLDTDGISIDGIVGINGFTIDLADNTVAGFWAAGSRYTVIVSSVTIDSQTVNFVAATFRIGLPHAVLNTTIATLASQTSFTLTAGPAEDDALNGCAVYIHDVASAVQGGFAYIADYTGSTKTVTLAAGTTFTAAATDNISVFAPSNVHAWQGSPVATPTVAGVPEVDQTHRLGSAVSGAELALADVPVAYAKNVAVTAFGFYMELTDGSPGTGLTVTGAVSKDGGAFAGLASSVTEISAGWYEVDIAQAEMNADEVALKFTATGAKQRNFKIRTQA